MREWDPAHECGRVLSGHRHGALEVTEKVKDTGTDASGTVGGSSLGCFQFLREVKSGPQLSVMEGKEVLEDGGGEGMKLSSRGAGKRTNRHNC